MYSKKRRNAVRASALGVALIVGLAACSGSDSDSSTSSAEAETTPAESTTPDTTTPETTTPETTTPETTTPETTTPETTTSEATTTLAPADPLIGIGDVTVVAEGLGFLEGPAWRPDSGTLLFTELFTNTDEPFAAQPGIIYEVGANDEVTVARASGPTANGIEVAENGTLYATEPGERRGAQISNDGVETAVAEQFEGKRFNGPNDVVAAADGSLYFTDPEPQNEAVDAELGFRGAFRLGPDGDVTVVYPGDQTGFPNGVGLSPDQTRLYVSDSPARTIWAIDLGPDGAPSEPVVFATLEGSPDGMCVDQAGNLFSTSFGVGIEVFAPDGTRWGTIPISGFASNCEFGGEDGLGLYITSAGSLYRVSLAPRGGLGR